MNASLSLRAALIVALCLAVGAFAPRLKANPDNDEPPARGLVRHLDKLHDKLQLRPEQQWLWDTARQSSVRAQVESRAGKRAVTELSETELERPMPDLGLLSRRLEEFEQRNLAAERQTRALWLKVYETLSPQQIAVVREALKSELRRYKLLQNLRERFLG
jgi:hypothetical protein